MRDRVVDGARRCSSHARTCLLSDARGGGHALGFSLVMPVWVRSWRGEAVGWVGGRGRARTASLGPSQRVCALTC